MKLGNYVKILSGYAFDSKEFNENGVGMPIIRIRDVGKDKISTYYSGVFNEDFIIQKGDLLIGMDGDFRLAKWLCEDALLNQRVCKIQVNSNELYSDYLFYYLPKELKKIEDSTSFATVKHLSVKKIQDIQIPLPPLDQQKKIASILDAADAYRQKTKALIKKYDELTQSLFLDMFGDPVKNEKGWEKVCFTEVLVLKRGYDLPVQDRVSGQHPIMASNGILDWHNEFKVKGPGIITGRSGTLGQVHITYEDYWPLNTALYSQNLKGNNPHYILYLLKNFKVERFARGAGVPTLNRNLVHDELIINIPITLQNQFAERVQVIEQQKAKAQESLEKAEELFDSLLQKAFNGELVEP
jgi:type I restriction enzyme S subunit